MLSVSKVTKKLSCFIFFYPDFCMFQDLLSGKVKGIDKKDDGLYIFRSELGIKNLQSTKCDSRKVVAEVIKQEI